MTPGYAQERLRCVGAALITSAAAVLAVTPWPICGKASLDEALLRFFYPHLGFLLIPRLGLLISLAFLLPISFAVARVVGPKVRPMSPWALVPLAGAAWVAFEVWRWAWGHFMFSELPRWAQDWPGCVTWLPLFVVSLVSVLRLRCAVGSTDGHSRAAEQ